MNKNILYVYTRIHTYLHTYIPTHTHTHTYIHTYIPTYTHTYIHTYILYIHTYLRTHIHTYIHTHQWLDGSVCILQTRMTRKWSVSKGLIAAPPPQTLLMILENSSPLSTLQYLAPLVLLMSSTKATFRSCTGCNQTPRPLNTRATPT